MTLSPGKDVLALRQKIFAQLRTASDAVRAELIPSLNAENVRLKDAYFRINQSYFEDDVLHGQLVGGNDLESFLEVGASDKFYQTSLDDITALRTSRGNVAGFEVLHPRFLDIIADRTFKAMEMAQAFKNESEFVNFLTVADSLFQLAHLCKDGSGRTGEDMLVLCGDRYGYPLTFSLTGYRAVIDGAGHLMFFRHVTEKIFHAEVVRNFFRWAGVDAPRDIPTHIRDLLNRFVNMNSASRRQRLGLPDNLNETVSVILESVALGENETQTELQPTHPYSLYATFIARECVYLTLCLEDLGRLYPSLCERYPLTMACRSHDLQEAGRQTYHCIASEAADVADATAARLDLKRAGQLQDELTLQQRMTTLQATEPRVAKLIQAELNRASLRTLLSRVRVPVRPTMNANDVRTVVEESMNWSL